MSTSRDSPLRAERDGEVVRIDGEQVAIAYDPDGEFWFARASSVPGLSATSESREELLDALPFLIRQARMP